MTRARAIGFPPILAWLLTVCAVAAILAVSGRAEARSVARADIQQMVAAEAARAGVPVALALAVAKVESNFRADAESSAGARGVMQIMPKTGKDLYGVEADELWDPQLNIRIGVDFLRSLIDRYGRWDLALSHYNGGSRVGTPPNAKVIPATQGYVDAVLAWQRRFERRDTAVAMADAVEARKAMPSRITEAPVAYWMFDDPTVQKDWRHYLKVADYWLGKRKDYPGQESAANEPQDPDTPTAKGSEFPVETLEPAPGRPSDDLRRNMAARRMQFRDRLESGSRPWRYGDPTDRFGYR